MCTNTRLSNSLFRFPQFPGPNRSPGRFLLAKPTYFATQLIAWQCFNSPTSIAQRIPQNFSEFFSATLLPLSPLFMAANNAPPNKQHH